MSTHILEGLNDAQRQAASYLGGPLLIVAGPGSGKTRVLTYRIAYLISQGVAPFEILALTFTNKAAREMKERIAKVVGDRAKYVYAGTFHSLFARFLRSEAELLGYPKDFSIYDTDDCRSLMGKIIKDKALDPKVYTPANVLSRISNAKSSLISPASYAAKPELLADDNRMGIPAMAELYATYQSRLKQAGAMDFDDLLFNFYRLLREHDAVCQKYRDKFRHVLVDEFQDTNFLQYAILRKLCKGGTNPSIISAVGDDAQSIYAFRGATIENIFDFEKDFPDLKTVKLEQNYRSTHHIVEAANNVISRNTKQIKKTIWTNKGKGNRIKIVKTSSDQEEGKRVADIIVEQKNRYQLRNADFAILYRTNAQARIFEEMLRRHNLPYRVYGGMSFFQRKEVKDLLAYLRLSVNPYDEEAMRRVINLPRRGIGDALIDKVTLWARSHNLRFWDALKDYNGEPREMRSLGTFVALVYDFKDIAARLPADKAARHIYRASGLQDLLRNDTSKEGLEHQELCESVLNGIAEFVAQDEILVNDDFLTDDRSLSRYLQNIALITDADQATDGDLVTLMSVHSAKGLEFKSVIVTGLEENLFPGRRALEEPDGLDEERRLFYVAVTRAEMLLTLTYSMSRYQFGKQVFNRPSRFLSDIGDEHIETMTPLAGSISAVQENKPMRSGVHGLPRPTRPAPQIDLTNFAPSPIHDIQPGVKVLHQKFGYGTVLTLEGTGENKVAGIEFKDIDQPVRKLMLKFAKLQVVNS